ncbi:MAG: DUF5062 family protein [Candidatus Polarisedimenticolaceae bacterium]|nr:DUF5062 family protein [Candidatus Polarisedimenticolaceae bacterium]
MKKLKNEKGLLKEALRVGMIYAEKRGAAEFDPTDSHHLKIEYIYRLLVHDKQIQPLAKGQVDEPNMRHKLAIWIFKLLPEEHPLKK